MADEGMTSTYRIGEPFGKALRRVRTALADADLEICGEWDLASNIRDTLMVSLPPCVVLFASSAACAGEDVLADPPAAAMVPFHIVVSACGSETEVHFLKALPAVGQLQGAVSRAVEKIGRRVLEV